MAIDDPYLSVNEFKATLDSVGNIQDEAIQRALKSASRQIERFTGRVFNQSGDNEARYFTAYGLGVGYVTYGYGYLRRLYVDDFTELTSLSIDNGRALWDDVWDADQYRAVGLNSPGLAMPYNAIEAIGSRAFPLGTDWIKINATWGWPAVPDDVREACHLIANRLKSLWTAPFGRTGAGEMGGGLDMTTALSPLIREILAPYRVLPV